MNISYKMTNTSESNRFTGVFYLVAILMISPSRLVLLVVHLQQAIKGFVLLSDL